MDMSPQEEIRKLIKSNVSDGVYLTVINLLADMVDAHAVTKSQLADEKLKAVELEPQKEVLNEMIDASEAANEKLKESARREGLEVGIINDTHTNTTNQTY